MLGEQVAVFDKCGLGFNIQNDLNHKLKNVLKQIITQNLCATIAIKMVT